jgi:tryptophanyl-tRNA synthetase
MKRILSGIKPSGAIHIGNYFAMIKPMVDSQLRGTLLCFIANLHAQTTLFEGKRLSQLTKDAFIDLLALGIDPHKSILWVQSDVPEVCELTWYLSTVTPFGLLQRCHAYKDAVANDIAASDGLFQYPVLMAADILLYQSNIVPVGRDQKQHVEVSRDIALKFNQVFGEVLTIPEPEIAESFAVLSGLDGRKMSKSYDNTLEIFGDEKVLRKKVMGIITDSTPVEAPKDPDASVIYQLYSLFVNKEKAEEMAQKYRAGGMGYGEAKKELFGVFWEYFRPYREQRAKIEADKVYVDEMRKLGEQKARALAMETLEKVRELVGTAI